MFDHRVHHLWDDGTYENTMETKDICFRFLFGKDETSIFAFADIFFD